MSQNTNTHPSVTTHESTKQINASRRNLLKLVVGGVVTGLVFPLVTRVSMANAAEAGSKALIVYFSKTGNTRDVAQQIQSITGADLLELKTAHSYPENYRETTTLAKTEQTNNFRPQLVNSFPDMQAYSTIFIGYPNWWGTMPMAFYSFFEKYPLAGKTVAPFCTHAGSGLGRGPEAIAQLCPQATLLDGLAVRGTKSSDSQEDVSKWLQRIGIAR